MKLFQKNGLFAGMDDQPVYVGAVDDGTGNSTPTAQALQTTAVGPMNPIMPSPAATIGSIVGLVAGGFGGRKTWKKHKNLGMVGGALLGSALGGAAGRLIGG